MLSLRSRLSSESSYEVSRYFDVFRLLVSTGKGRNTYLGHIVMGASPKHHTWYMIHCKNHTCQITISLFTDLHFFLINPSLSFSSSRIQKTNGLRDFPGSDSSDSSPSRRRFPPIWLWGKQ